jgi:Na+-driven multidrug efflux pump
MSSPVATGSVQGVMAGSTASRRELRRRRRERVVLMVVGMVALLALLLAAVLVLGHGVARHGGSTGTIGSAMAGPIR